MVIRDLVCHLILSIVSSHQLIRNFDLICTALLNQFVILCITNHALFALLKALPLLIFDHCRVGIHILTLELDLFKFFSQSGVLLCLVQLLSWNLGVGCLEALLTCSLSCHLLVHIILLAALLYCLGWLVASFTCLFDPLWIFHQCLRVTFLLSKVAVTFKFEFLS